MMITLSLPALAQSNHHGRWLHLRMDYQRSRLRQKLGKEQILLQYKLKEILLFFGTIKE